MRIVIVLLLLAGSVASAQPTASCIGRGTERAEYVVRYGVFTLGASTIVVTDDTLDGVPVRHLNLTIRGGPPFFRVHDQVDSWFTTNPWRSVRYTESLREGRSHTERSVRFDHARGVMIDSSRGEQPTVAMPLDEAAFLYFVRSLSLSAASTYQAATNPVVAWNPIAVRAVGRERVRVPYGERDAVVLAPSMRGSKLFDEDSGARVWIASDSTRMLLKFVAKAPLGTLRLELRRHEVTAPGC